MRERNLTTWVFLGVVLLALLNLPRSASSRVKSALREGVAPLQQAFSVISFRVREAMTVFRGLGGIARENREMAEHLVQLRKEVQDLKALEHENIELREQLRFRQHLIHKCHVPCEVIGRDASGWWQTVRLGKGFAEGVAVDRAVVTPDGLVGKTTDVSTHTADVLLISDRGCKVSCRISRTGAFGLLSGKGVSHRAGAGCRMEFINKDTTVRPGDDVVTSGLGGVFPKGLLVGYVEKVYMDRSGLYQYADVVAKADLGMLTYVFVIAEEDDLPLELLRTRQLPQVEETE